MEGLLAALGWGIVLACRSLYDSDSDRLLGKACQAFRGQTQSGPLSGTRLGILAANGDMLAKDQPTVSECAVTVSIKVLEVRESVVVKYSTGTKKALLHNVAGDVKVILRWQLLRSPPLSLLRLQLDVVAVLERLKPLLI